MPHERWGGVDRAEETWYNHGTTTISTSSLGGLGCLQHPQGIGASFSRSLPITGRRFSTPIRVIRPPITMVWWARCSPVATPRRSGTWNTAVCTVGSQEHSAENLRLGVMAD